MLAVEAWAKNKGFSCFYVCSGTDEDAFYKKCGYADHDDVFMRKTDA